MAQRQVHCVLLVLVAALGYAKGEVVGFQTCTDEDVASCTINEVRVLPCPQAANDAPCRLPRRKPSTMSFDFTPNFDAEVLEADLNWVKSASEELPLVTMQRDACKSTTCPVRSGVKQTYEIAVPIERKFPTSSYTIKWTLKEPQGKRCCFTIDIKVVR